MGTMGEGFGLFAETFRFFGKSFFKRDGLRETTALLHDTTSSLRALTAGFEFLCLICRRAAFSSKVNFSNQATVIFKLGH
jgi:hypothetical protein